jgi:predicted transcriptional regulator of viral defense system
MNSLDLMESLKRYPVFDAAQFALMTGLDPASAKVRLFRMRRQGRILGIQRDAFTVLKDPLLIASRIVWPSYISLWYALSYHHMTLQVVHEITVLTSRQTFRKQLEFQGTRINFVLIPPVFLYGYDRLDIGDHEVFMAYPEKAILDALHLHRISVSEISEIVSEHEDELDLERLVEFAKRCNDEKTIRRLGFILERSGHRKVAGLRPVKGKPLAAEPSFPPDGPLNIRWGVIDNLGGEG